MSFVSICAKESFISVVSDGLIKNMETGEEVGQRYQKFAKISDNQFVAFTGNHGLAEAIKVTLPFDTRGYDLEGVSKLIHKRLLDDIPIEKAKMAVAIGGVNQDNNIEFHSFINDPTKKFNSFQPKDDKLSYSFLESPEMEGFDLEILFKEYISTIGHNTPSKILRVQKRLNDFVAANDSSVNRITFNLMIRKP